MTIANGERTYQLKALTDLWTGNANRNSDRLITTGLLGSIRWWFEVLVRGLGGSACDPTDTKCEDRNHCVVCELFGCTGWARKFRFEVSDGNGNAKVDQIKQNQNFNLRFTPLRPICDEEWALLDATLRLIAEYGAIGGKTVFKLTDESDRASKLHHKDYGLVQMVTSQQFAEICRDDLEKYLSKWRKLNHGEFAWASLQHFWCVNGKYLGRVDNNKSTFNQVLGRQEAKNQGQQLATQNDGIARWLAGSQQESKKVFSFKNPARTFGFVKPDLIDFDAMKERLASVWGKNGWEFLTGDKVIKQLFAGKKDRP
ncbi:MAG TPA: type III-B CRISPR module RAMP protein Cmr1 [Verrucomicrobiota bacterium]|jgi:CRISPR-associated protein Cmr1|nr:type III-B CRISPR module RAMP protein Cmr1 [Sedimentisphaerales bacterium]HQK02349.1 type III-B CRISPR module RAMP protein Cmr1 [Verrucomicrobiota bacterium]